MADYAKGFSDGSGPDRMGAVSVMPKGEFTDWVNSGGPAKGALAYKAQKGASEPALRMREPQDQTETAPTVTPAQSLPLASETYLRTAWDAAIDTARANGLDVTVLQGVFERGVYSQRGIVLAVAEPLNPSRDNLTLLFHEIGHDVFEQLGLPADMAEAFHRAIAKLAVPEAFNIKLAPGVDRAAVTAEEVLVERAARNLVAEGFNPAESTGIARRLIDLLKRIYLRGVIAVQQSLLGPDHVNPELAQRYFEARLRSFLAGSAGPMNLLSFLGGAKLTMAQRSESFESAGGAGLLPAYWDPTAGAMVHREVLPDTLSAVAHNRQIATRYSSPRQSRLTAVPKVGRRFGDVNPNTMIDEAAALKAPIPSWFPQPRREQFALEYFESLPERFTNQYGQTFWLKKPERGYAGPEAMAQRALHWVRPEANQGQAIHKGLTVRSVLRTLENPSFVLKQTDSDLHLYARVYPDQERAGNGLVHFVIVDPKDSSVVTQFPFSDASGTKHNQDEFVWVRPSVKPEEAAAAFQATGGALPPGSQPPGATRKTTSAPEEAQGRLTSAEDGSQADVRFSERGPASPAFVRVSDPHLISGDLDSSEKVKEDIAAYNALGDIHARLFKVFGDEGLSKPGYGFEQFLVDFTNADSTTAEKVFQRNEELKANGLAPQDPTLRPLDLLAEPSQMAAADKAYRYAWALREYWAKRRRDSENVLRTASDRALAVRTRLHALASDHTDMAVQLENARTELADLLGEFGADMKSAVNSARKLGALGQVLVQLEQRQADPLLVARQYQPVIDKLYRRITGESGASFVDLLRRVAALPANWSMLPTGDAIWLVSKVVAPSDPELKHLEHRALASIVVAFAKRNEHVMEWLKLAQSDALEDRRAVNELVKEALSGSKAAMDRAKELAAKLPKLAVTAQRLLSKLQESQDESRSLTDEMQRARVFIDLHTHAVPHLRDEMTALERILGARLSSWEPVHGAEYFVAPSPKATPEQVLSNTRVFNLKGDGQTFAEVVEHISGNRAWLREVPEDKRGATWNTVHLQTEKLETQVAIVRHELVIKRSVVNTLLGSLPDKLQSVGIPALASAAKRVRHASAELFAASRDADNLGIAWLRAKGQAMKALGMNQAGTGTFDRLFFQAALDFAEKNADLRARYKTDKEAFEALLPKLRKHFETDPDTGSMVERPGAWQALQGFYRATYQSQEWVDALRGKLGIKIRETGPDGYAIEREPIGATFFTSTRRINSQAVRLYHEMRDLGWLGTDADGRLTAAETARLYLTDRPGLEAKLKKRFTGEVWPLFVEPLARREGRSSFYGLKRTDGLTPMALRENVRKAFEAAQGDPLRFAETLYSLEESRSSLAGESQADFVGKTLATFQEFFDSLHATQADIDESLRLGLPTPPRLLQDARVSEAWPGEWLEYETFGRLEMHQMTNLLVHQGAYGRNMEGMRRDLQTGIGDPKRHRVVGIGRQHHLPD